MAEEYRSAKKAGDKAFHQAVLHGQYPYLPALDDILAGEGMLPETPVGTFEIPMELIAGTKTHGRQNAFAVNFMPILAEDSEFAGKWQRLYDSQVAEGIRDPIKVYEYMRRFYVEEGNKRVSCSRFLEAPMIRADVTRILPKRTKEKDNIVYYEFLDFYKVAPTYELEFTEPGSYREFAEKIGRDLTEPWPEDVMKNVLSAYLIFRGIYEEFGGQQLRTTPADALLIYMHVYELYGILTEDRNVIRRRVERLWNEFLTEANEQSTSLVLRPEDAPKPESGIVPRLTSLWKSPKYTEKMPLKVAFLYARDPANSRSAYAHELGRNQLETTFQGLVRTRAYSSCGTEENFMRAVDSAVSAGCDVIFTTSPTMIDDTLRAAIHFPEVKFLNCSINLSRNAVRTYYARLYEAKFLMGALAASLAPNHRIGYRADLPTYGDIANINAFAIGAEMVDPHVEIILKWAPEDPDWLGSMRRMNVSVISGPNLIRPSQESRAYGVYHMAEDGTITSLAAPVLQWGTYYELIVRTILNGTWDARPMVQKDRALSYWYGMSAGVIDVILSDHLPYSSRKLVLTLKNALIADTLNPFEGELHSQKGLIQGPDAPKLPTEEIIRMAWLNDNVNGKFPDYQKLNSDAKKAVQVSGVGEDDGAGVGKTPESGD